MPNNTDGDDNNANNKKNNNNGNKFNVIAIVPVFFIMQQYRTNENGERERGRKKEELSDSIDCFLFDAQIKDNGKMVIPQNILRMILRK